MNFKDIFFDSYIFTDHNYPENNYCHSSVLVNEDPSDNTIVLGTVFMRQFYTVFERNVDSTKPNNMYIGTKNESYGMGPGPGFNHNKEDANDIGVNYKAWEPPTPVEPPAPTPPEEPFWDDEKKLFAFIGGLVLIYWILHKWDARRMQWKIENNEYIR